MMNISGILGGLQAALGTVKKFAPVAEAFGLPAVVSTVAEVASAAIEVAENAIERINDGRVVASNEDAAQVRSILAELQAENDKLAAKIAAS